MDERFCEPGSMISDDALFRATGAPLIRGNSLRILRDGRENYPEWEAAIRIARKTIHLEMYVVHDDSTGRHFRDLLVQKATEGVKVRVLYDWFGARAFLGRRMWKPLLQAGGEMRVANPPKVSSLLGWASRDHRKLITVDGSVAFISGLCIGEVWVGNPSRDVAPWRDTGVVIHGPAVADAEDAFADAWRLAGGVLMQDDLPQHDDVSAVGNVAVRVVAASPETAGLYRLDLLIATAAQEYLWLTDAYFMGTTSYLQALRSAAMDGVDVRLLVPHGSDIQWIASFSRTSYQSLLEAGVRVYEWNGPMIHAKTAVCDGRLARVGSTNLNLSSWIGNWELDVLIEDEDLAEQMGEMFLDDLARSTEIIITGQNKVRPVRRLPRARPPRVIRGSGKSVLIRAVIAGSALNAAVTGRRPLSRSESSSLLSFGSVLFAIALTAFLLPSVVAFPLGAVLGWIGLFLLIKALRLRFVKQKQTEENEAE